MGLLSVINYLFGMVLLQTGSCLGGSTPVDLQVRLVGGPNNKEGRVEVRLGDGDWGTICSNGFDSQDATVVCRQLKLGQRGLETSNTQHGAPPEHMYVDEIRCNGSETNIGHCRHRDSGEKEEDHGCLPSDAVSVICFESGDLQVRLVGGPSRKEGRVEVRLRGGDWGSICDDYFDNRDATVVCRQLKLGRRAMVMRKPKHGRPPAEMHFGMTGCDGSESSIGHCQLRGWRIHYGHPSRAVSVVCFEDNDLQVRLVGGPSGKEGRVEVRLRDGDWGSICDDNFDNRDATVVCRQLKLGQMGMAVSNTQHGTPPEKVRLDRMLCNGSETSIGHCRHSGWGTHKCDPSQVVSVLCFEDGDLQVRLVGGPNRKEGRVEIRLRDGDWGTICSNGFDNQDATVVCRQLKLGQMGMEMESPRHGTPPVKMHLNWMMCDGSEPSIGHCREHWVWGAVHRCSSTAVSAVCFDDGDIQVRLVGGPNRKEGRVEVRLRDGDWGTICRDDFNGKYATIVCRQLKLSNNGVVMSSTQHGAPPEKVHLGWIWCDGSETKIQHCSHSGWGTHRCDPSRAVSILCSEGDLQVRLVGGPNNKEGRVEVRLGDGDWGSVCGYRFDYKDARVVCRQLELDDSGTVLPKTQYPPPPGKVYRLKKVKCHGSELNLGHCTHGGWGDYSCNISKAASIRCYGERPLETTPTPNPLPESNKTSALRKLANSEVTEQTVVETRKALELPEETTAADVVLVAVILHRASRLQDVSQQTATDLLKIVDTVAALNQSVLHESNSVGNSTNRLIVAVEEVADRVTLPAEGTVRLQTNGTVLQVWNLTSAAFPPSSFLGLVLKSDGELVKVTLDSSPLDRHLYADVDTAVLLPWGIGRKIVEASPGHDVRLSASVVTQTSLFQTKSEQTDTADTDTSQAQSTEEKEEEEEDRRTARARLNSKVISLRVTVDGRPVTDLAQFGQENVTTVFQPLQTLTSKTEAERRERTRCVFWDFAEREGRGAWSTEGCHLERLVAEKTVCQCTRLSTLFAIIITDLYDPGMETIELHEDVLSDITKGGLTVSICGLILTLLAFIFVKNLHKSLPQLALFNLSLALLLSWVAFLAGVRRVGSHGTCMAVAMLLHHLILATFLWTLVQGTVLLCVVLIKGRESLEPPPPSTSTPTRFMLKAGLTAWGLPALPVIIVSAIDVELYRGGDKYCWMSLQPFYYAFLAPVAVIVTIIIIIYVLVAVSLCLRRRRPNTGHGGSGDSAVNGVCASVSCFVVLVLSWVFAFFALEDARLVFQHLFACTTAIQGVVIFIMYPARDPDVRAFLLQSFGVRGGFPTQQQQQQIMIPLHRPETSPNSELEMSPTSGLDMSPTSEQEMSPTSEQEMSPTSELEMPSGSECEEQTASTGDTSFAPSSH